MKQFKIIIFAALVCAFSCIASIDAQSIRQNRIVSLVPSQTELLFKLGFGKDIVGVSDFCNYPEATEKITKVGGMELNIERIMSLQPTLILDLNSMHKRYEILFRQLGLNYVDITINKLSDIPLAAKSIASILSDEKNSESFVLEWNKSIAELNAGKPEHTPKVYLEIWDTPMQAAGPASFMGEMIEVAGGKNIITTMSDYPVVNSEHIIAANPDIILLSYPLTNTDSIKRRPGWENIEAVKKNQIFHLDQDLFVRPGPRNIEGLTVLRKYFSAIPR
ncbi:MAG: cobalamin-binding protein [Candidatus Rifleibacteriota bacterium]